MDRVVVIDARRVLSRQDVICRLCGRNLREGERFSGVDMWHWWRPTCNHEEFFTCPGCEFSGNPQVKCLACGRNEFFC